MPRFHTVLLSTLLIATACAGARHDRSPATQDPVVQTVHDELAGVRLTNSSGEVVTLSSVRKPVTVVALWASYCGSCMSKLPALEAFSRAHSGDPDVAVIAVNVDEKALHDEARTLLAELAPSTSGYFASAKMLAAVLPQTEQGEPRLLLPMLIVLDERGTIHHNVKAPHELDEVLAQWNNLVNEARSGSLQSNVVPPTLYSSIEITQHGKGYKFRIAFSSEPSDELRENLIKTVQDFSPSLDREQVRVDVGVQFDRGDTVFYPSHATAEQQGAPKPTSG